MDKQKQMIEEKKEIAKELDKVYPNAKFTNGWIAEVLYKLGYRKIPENAVVIPKEISYYGDIEKRVVTAKLYGEKVDFTPEQIMALTIIFHHKELQEKEIRKETAEKFAERLKEKCKELQDKYSHICKSKFEMIQETCRYEGVTAVKNSIDEIAKEFTEGSNG